MKTGSQQFGGPLEFFDLGEVLVAASSMSGGVAASAVKLFARLASSTDGGSSGCIASSICIFR